jgi:hypothetical protein
MLSYKLEDKKMDSDFLGGRPVIGKAVIPTSSPLYAIQEGDAILIVLSNGKKYKGKVIKFEFFLLNDHHVGEIEFIRS